MELSLSEAILRLLLATILASVIGLERELSRQSAGLRTHILVCLGSAAFTLVSISDLTHGMSLKQVLDGHSGVHFNLNRDPARIAAQIVTGIGFIGGGAVLRHGNSIRGLTTAASLWMMASVGMLCGVGQYYLAGVTTFFSFLVLFTIGSLERNFLNKELRKFSRMRVSIKVADAHHDKVQQWVERQFGPEVIESRSSREEDKSTSLTYAVNLSGNPLDVNRLSRQLNALDGVTSCSVRVYHEEGEA